jgi:hypothetical protein
MMDLTKLKKLSIGGVELKQLFINGVQVWKSGYKNWVRHSTEADGSTIYNGGLGYKEGYRIRSGGTEATSDRGVCTGFIPFKKGDILRIYPAFSGQNTVNTLNFADASFTNLGQYNDNGGTYGICTEDNTWRTGIATEVGDITVIDISVVSNGANIAYVRLTHSWYSNGAGTWPHVTSGSELIVTVNEEIT